MIPLTLAETLAWHKARAAEESASRGAGDPDAHGYPDQDPGDEQPEPYTEF